MWMSSRTKSPWWDLPYKTFRLIKCDVRFGLKLSEIHTKVDTSETSFYDWFSKQFDLQNFKFPKKNISQLYSFLYNWEIVKFLYMILKIPQTDHENSQTCHIWCGSGQIWYIRAKIWHHCTPRTRLVQWHQNVVSDAENMFCFVYIFWK